LDYHLPPESVITIDRYTQQLRQKTATFDKAVRVLVKSNPTCRHLMGVPGIGVLSVLAYVSMVEDPARFGRSRSVGAHLGLTSKQYQSGEIDRSGRISKCGDALARTLMYEAAVVLMTRVKRALGLKDWARSIAKRSGAGKARVALARKLAVILHSMWRSGSHSTGPSSRRPSDDTFTRIHPGVASDGMIARQGEGAGDCDGGL
jgi:transposase